MRLSLVAVLALLGISVTGFLAILIEAPIVPRDRPLQSTPLHETKRITFLGTSLTADYDWPERFEGCSGSDFFVSKIAKGGAGSDWGKAQLAALDASDPDIVFVEFAINDADLRNRISRAESLKYHRMILNHLREAHPDIQIVLMTMSSAQGLRRYLLRPRLPTYYALYQDLADEFESGLLDLYPRWRALDKATRDQKDGLHPSQQSAAQVILPALSAYLGVPLDRACAGLDYS